MYTSDIKKVFVPFFFIFWSTCMNIYKILLLLTFVFTSYLLWYISADYIEKNTVNNISKSHSSSDKNSEKLSRMWIIESKLHGIGILEENDLELSTFWEVYSTIKSEYYEVEWVKKADLINWMSKWLVEALWDKHSEFLDMEENESFMKMLSWDFEWIWAVVDKLDFGVKIERVLKWSPAEKFGLLKDDIIIEANEEELQDLSLFDAVAKIKGPAGTPVMLKVLRSWEDEALDIKVIRDKIKIPSIEEKYFEEEKIGYIALNLYWEETAREFREALKSLEGKDTNGLIIDVRNNWWWLLLSAVEILSEFIPQGELLVTTKYKDAQANEVYTSINSWTLYWKKIVVLINGSSASASEITAGALREYNKAILIWEKTYGKWSVQKPFMMDDGSMLKLTIAKWFTPLDRNIDDEGIEPDVEIEFEKQDYNLKACIESWRCEEYMKQEDFEIYDRQLEEAKTILQSFITKWNLQLVIDEQNERLWNETEKDWDEAQWTEEKWEEWENKKDLQRNNNEQ